MPLEMQIRTTKQTDQLLKDMPKMIREGLTEGMIQSMDLAEISAKRGIGKAGRPKNITGTLRNSIKDGTKIAGNQFIGSIWSDVIYARIHEEGGIIRAKGGGMLRFQVDGKWRIADSVKIPQREFLRPAIEDNLGRIRKIITDSVSEEFK